MISINEQQLNEDLAIFVLQLIKYHPNPYKYISKDSFDAEISKIRKGNEKESIKDYGISLMKLLSKLKDGHTELCPSDDVLGTLNYPIKLRYFIDGYYLTNVSEKYVKLLGGKLTKIDNRNIEEIERILKDLISIENKTSIKYYFPKYLYEPVILNYFGITQEDSTTFTFEKDAREESVVITPISYNEQLVGITDGLKNIEETLAEKSLYWGKKIGEINSYYFQYNSCEILKDYPISKVIEEIKESKCIRVIVDLRNNTGGDSDVLEPLIDFLNLECEKIKTVVLTGSKTYSSAIINLVFLSRIKNSISIGEIPHANPTHFGTTTKFELPNSKLSIQVSTDFLRYRGYKLGEVFTPTYEVNTTIGDYEKGVDTQMKFLKNL
ncbi:hypothetical protein M0R04_03775 [Candidatus Dojkabacteria bacterium]|jgi:hypothetical protein|nr:hypothetical protein [Candidatus Dojkabacteria bacterium]